MSPDFVRRMSAPMPRYTSYPTAPHFKSDVGPLAYAESIARLASDATLSLYMHIPFCAELCWYCGCSTKAVKSREPVRDYLNWLRIEMTVVAAFRQGAREVSHIHWGGGSPNILEASEIADLAVVTRELYSISPSAEFAVEIDPRSLGDDQIAAFAHAGVNRVSIGVQDFDPEVQKAINRRQSFEVTQRAVTALRAAGVPFVNLDLVYGLPHQTRESVARTIEKVIQLNPDRIALFGYAHLPERAKNQSLIDSAILPNDVERFAQSQRARRLLKSAGYVAVGLDHFAKPGDALVRGPIRRNFQGYTTDMADALIGFGASAISRLPDGYFQNAVARHDYIRRVADHGLATARGVLLSEEDRARAFVIEKLMCESRFSESAVRARFGALASPIIREAHDLLETDRDGLLVRTADGFQLSPRGEPFMRTIAACFDVYGERAA